MYTYIVSKSIRILTGIAAAVSALVVVAAVALCVAFPNKYSGNIDAAADEFSLDRALVRSVVWAESKFDSRAVSNKGASGLMQLMPETYAACAKALGISGGDGGIFDVDNSLRCGCYYLSLLIEKYDGDENAALMAYNAGEANANKFLAGEPVFEQTKKYLKDIALAQSVYSVFSSR